MELWEQVKQRSTHQDCPPPVLSDGWGGHREVVLDVYWTPTYYERGRPPTRKQAADTWHYTQMVKQHDEHGHFCGVDIRVIYGDETTLDLTGERTAYSVFQVG